MVNQVALVPLACETGQLTTGDLALRTGRVVPRRFQPNSKHSLTCARSHRGARRALCTRSDEICCIASRFVGVLRPRILAFNQGVPGSSPGRLTNTYSTPTLE
jgi:hypothetical protein